MKKSVKTQILAACEKVNLSDFWASCVVELYELQEKSYKKKTRSKVLANVVSVSRSGMSRRVEFGMIRKNGEYQNITPALAALYGAKLKDDYTFQVNGCGMDMLFSVLNTVFYRITPAAEHGKYNFFCRYERF